MPRVNVTGIGVIDFPDDMTQDQIANAIETELPTYLETKRKQDEEPVVPDLSMGEAFKRSVVRGGKQISSAFGDVIPAIGASALGFDEYAKRQMEEAAGTQEEIARKYAAGVPSYKNVKDIGSGAQYLVESVGEQLPQLATAIVPGGVGAMIGRRAAVGAAEAAGLGLKETAATIAARQNLGQNVGVYLGSYSQVAPEVFQNIYNETGQLEPGVSLLFSSVGAALDSAFPSYLMNKITTPTKIGIVEKLLEKSGMEPGIIRKALASLPESVALEGLTEGTQEAISMKAENFIDQNKGLFDSKGWERILESTIKGAVAGGAFGTATGAIEGIKDRVAQPQPSTEEPAPGTDLGTTGLPPTTPLSPSDTTINKALFVDEDLINTLGLPSNAGIVRRIKDLEINQENASKIQTELSKYQGDDAVKQNINKLLARPEFEGVQIGKQPRGTKTTGLGSNIPVSAGSAQTTPTTQTTITDGTGNVGAGVDATELARRAKGSAAAKADTLGVMSEADQLRNQAATIQKELDSQSTLPEIIKQSMRDQIASLQKQATEAESRKEELLKPLQKTATKQTKYDYSAVSPIIEQAYNDGVITPENYNAAKQMMANNIHPPEMLIGMVENARKQQEAGVTGTGKKVLPANQQKAANVWNSVSNRIKFNDLVPEDQATIVDAHNNNRLDRDLVDEIVEGGGYLDDSYNRISRNETTGESFKDSSFDEREILDIHDILSNSSTLGKALKSIKQQHYSNLSRPYQRLIDKLLTVKKALNTKLYHTATMSHRETTKESIIPGVYSRIDHDIQTFKEAGLKTLLHEAVHAAVITETANHIVSVRKRDAQGNIVLDENGEEIWNHRIINDSALGKQLLSILNNAREAAKKEGIFKYYGITNVDEMLAEAFTDPMFQVFLSNQPGVTSPKTTLWQDFLNAIRGMLRIQDSQKTMLEDIVTLSAPLFKGKQNALDRTMDKLTGRDQEYYNVVNLGGVDPAGARKLINSVGETVKNLPAYNSTIAKEVRNVTSTLPDKLRGLAISFMSLPQKAELYGKNLPALNGLLKALELRGSTMERLHKEVEDLTYKGIKIIQDKKYNPQIIAKFNRIGTELSARKIDPRKDSKQENWDEELVRAWNSLPAPLRELGEEYADKYEKYRNDMIDMIEQLSGADLAAQMRKRFEKEKISFYFPLRRKGNYRLAFYDKDGIEETVQHFETPAELEAAKQKADKANATDIRTSMIGREINYKDTPPLGFVKTVIDKLGESIEDSPEKDTLINDVYKMYLDLFPDDSIRQQMKKREGVPGYIEDIVGGFADTGSRLATQLANLEHRPKLDALYKELDEQKRAFINNNPDIKENAAITQVVQDMVNQKKFVDNPVPDSWSAQLSWVSYIWNIAGNISSAVINLTQVPMVVMPMLGGEYTWNEAFDALSAAYKMYFKGNLFNDNNRNFLPDHTFGANLKPSDKHYKLYHAALNRSIIRRGIGYELNELRRKSTDDYTGTKSKIYTGLGWMFQNSERMNREVTLIAAYDLALKKHKGNVDAAIEDAIKLTTRAHSHTLTEAGPKMFQNGLGKVAFTFKRFAQAQIYNIARLFYVATKDLSAQERATARRQLFGIMGMTYMFSGLQGLPLYGALNMLSTAIAGMFGDDDEPYDFDEEIRAAFGDLGYKGPLNQILNVDIAARTGFNGMVFHDDPRRLAEVGFGPYFIEHFFGPAYQTIAVNPVRAAKLWDEGQTERALETLMPSVTKNMMKSFRFATEGATTTNGIKIIDDPGAYNNLMQIFGFTNADLSEAYTRASSMKQAEEKILKRRTQLLDLHYLAKINGDDDMLDKIDEDISKYNSKVPVGIKITRDTISRSNRGHKEREKQSRDGIVISKKLKDDIVEKYGD
jgi:hypothetical protein